MRRHILHVCAFCCGIVIGAAASLIIGLGMHVGTTRLPKVLSLLIKSKEILPFLGALRLVPGIGLLYSICTVTPETCNLRLNGRYITSGIAGAALVSILVVTLVVLGHFGFWWRVQSDVRDGILETVILGTIFSSFFVARHLIMEIEPGLGYCHHCGYDVRTIDSTQCPECGEQILNSISVKAVRNERDLVGLEQSRFAIVYLRHSEERLEEHAWVSFIRAMRKNIEKFPDADVYVVDVIQPLIKQWLDSPSRGQQLDTSDQVAFTARGVILWTASRFTPSYYLGSGADLLRGLMDHQQKRTLAPPAHFPNSFKKSSCIGRPSSLIFPYKH